MSAHQLRHFGKPEVLKTVSTKNLLALLKPHGEFLARHGIGLPESPDEMLTVYPQALPGDASCTFENAETGETRSLRAAELERDGFPLDLPPRAGAIWFYYW